MSIHSLFLFNNFQGQHWKLKKRLRNLKQRLAKCSKELEGFIIPTKSRQMYLDSYPGGLTSGECMSDHTSDFIMHFSSTRVSLDLILLLKFLRFT